MEKRWIVWVNEKRQEGIITDEERAAKLCVNGHWENGGATLIHDFLETFEDDIETFVLEEIDIADKEA